MCATTLTCADLCAMPMKPFIVPGDHAHRQPIQDGPAYTGRVMPMTACNSQSVPGEFLYDVSDKAHAFHNALLDWLGRAGNPVVLEIRHGQTAQFEPVIAYRMVYRKDPFDLSLTHVVCTVFSAGTTSTGKTSGERVSTYRYYYHLTGRIDHPDDGLWECDGAHHPAAIWLAVRELAG
ncbi:MAG: hypothetical protein WCK89_24130 [bacterium]